MVMELLEGKTLASKLHYDGRFAPKVACDIMMQIAEAMRYIHTRAIIHGDIKSENILLTRTPDRRRVVKLLDFGLARPDAAWRSSTLRLEGTPEYLAPERIRGEPASHASDIYALGVLFFELLVGRVPFCGSTDEVFRQHADAPLPPPSTLIPDEPLDERADEIVARAAAKNPADRQADISVFLYELRTLMTMLGGEKSRRRPPGPDDPAAPPPRRVDREEAAAAEVFDGAPLPMACVDGDGNVRVANKAFLEFLGAAGKAAGINLADSGMCDVYPALLDDLRSVVARKRVVKRILHLSEGGGHLVQVAVILSPSPATAPVTAGEVHVAMHPLARQPI
jgi:serine/threonine protein kinase